MEVLCVIVVALAQEEYAQRNYLRVARRRLRDSSNPFAISERHFIELFRLPKTLASQLIEELVPHLEVGVRSHSIPVRTKILAALSFYATGSYQRCVGQDFLLGMSQTSVSRCVVTVTNAINAHLGHKYIKFPRTEEERIEIKQRFYRGTGFPGVIGAVDCTHISIISPAQHLEHAYLNRKSFHSKNVQIICNYDLRILNIISRYAGATHDAFIWRCSQTCAALRRRYEAEGERTAWLLGDSGYPQQPWLMVPIRNPESHSQEVYNSKHRSARNCVERCNGVLKTRFRCILGERQLHYSPLMAGLITNACAVLHNIMVEARIPEPDISESEMSEINNNSFINDDLILESDLNTELIEGRIIRNRIISQHF